MNVKSVEKLEKSQVAVTVEVTAEEFEAAVQKAYLKMRNKISVPGFRPGKAPRKMIEKLYGEGVFYSDAVDAALPEAYTQAIGSSGLDVVGYPEVELGQYKGVSAVKEEVKVTADDVKERLNQMAEREGPEGAQLAACRHALRRRAADAGRRPRADVPPEGADDGRALPRPCAAGRAGDL